MRYFKSLGLLFFSLALLCTTAPVFGQTADQKIETFTKIWGFLKYHHPAIATGKMDWDSVYVVNLPRIEKTSGSEFTKQILAIINDLPPIKTDQPAQLPDSVFTANHDLSWISTSTLLSQQLKNKLQEIYKYRNQTQNRYVKLDVDRPDYSGEKPYESMVLPGKYYRLLFLARYWNIINYFAPYKYVIGEDWNKVLTRYIPRAITATDTVAWYKTLLHLAASINDGHGFYNRGPLIDVVLGTYTAPVYGVMINGTVAIKSFANDSLCTKAGIKKGDIVLAVDGEPIAKRFDRIGAYIPAANNESREHNVTETLFNTHNAYQNLEIKRGTQILTIKVKCIKTTERDWRELYPYASNKDGFKTVGSSIAYVYKGGINTSNMDIIKNLIKSKKAVIFDSRNYASSDEFYKGFYTLMNFFLPAPTEISMSTQALLNSPGYFKWHKTPTIGTIRKNPYAGKVIILADERNQSQGEYSVMVLQTIPHAITIGSITAGSDGKVTDIPMGGKAVLSYSGYGVYYPDKTPTQRQGIKIDIIAKKTIESTLNGHDPALEAALKYLRENGIE